MAADPAGRASPVDRVGPARRRVLGASLLTALAAAGVAGCGSGPAWPWAKPPEPSPEVGVLHGAIDAEDAIILKYTSVIAAFPSLTATVSPVLAQHRAHLAQLRARLVIPPGATPSESAAATARPRLARPRLPATPAAALRYLATAERGEAAALVGWLAAVTPSLAQLLASIGASEASHAALLDPAGTSR